MYALVFARDSIGQGFHLLGFGVGKLSYLQPVPPGAVQEIEVAVFALLGHLAGIEPLGSQVFDGMGPVDLRQGAGMVRLAVASVIVRGFLGQAGVDPAGGLVDVPQMTLGRVSVGNEEFQVGAAFQARSTTPTTRDSLLGGNWSDSHSRVRDR
jgi:hypothetical protein